MRYFFVGYAFTENEIQKVSSVTFTAPGMPSLSSITFNIKLSFPSFENIFVTPISEWSKEDYEKLILGENADRN